MPWRTKMMGWGRPALVLALDEILSGRSAGPEWDLSSVFCVFPTHRACRQFEELLVDRAESAGAALTPPVIETVGRLDEHLLPPGSMSPPLLANPLAMRGATAAAVRDLDEELRPRLLPRAPESGNWRHWLAIADWIARLRETLASHRESLRSVAARADLFDAPEDRARWQALVELEKAYLERLAAAGLVDRWTRREELLRSESARWSGDVYLVAAVDLNPAQLAMLDQAAASGATVHALVHAPSELADRFDRAGRLSAEKWLAAPIDLDDSLLLFAQGPADQALAALAAAADLAREHSLDGVKIGKPDEEVVPHLRDAAARLGLAVESADGASAAQSAPFRLLRLLADYGQSHDADSLAAIVRDPDVHDWLLVSGRVQSAIGLQRWIQLVDDYRAKFVPKRMPPDSAELRQACSDLAKSLALLRPLLDALGGANRSSAAEWARRFSNLLQIVYEKSLAVGSNSESSPTQGALAQIGRGLRALAEVPDALLADLSAEDALDLAAAELGPAARPAPASQSPLELLGWLDLPLERAPALVLTGMNEGKLSPKVESDLFLTDRIRDALDLPSDAARAARDRYALAAILASHKIGRIIAGKTSADGDPLAPSRLLLGDSTDLRARRARRFFGGPGEKFLLPRAGAEGLRIEVPRPDPARTIDGLSVTAFKDYLTCPYRFYLRHVLRLQPVDDDAAELDPMSFGSLAHEVLELFGRDEVVRDSTDPTTIRDFLDAQVLQLAHGRYRDAQPAVRVQLENLRRRLARFAERQAEWAAQGWRIWTVEQKVASPGAAFDVDGTPFFLRGRIDRVDVHRKTGAIAVLDYKTGERGESPERDHYSPIRGWFNLQLPLYRRLLDGLERLGLDPRGAAEVRLGYVLLPKNLDDVKVAIAGWTPAELEEAEEAARKVVRGVRKGCFEPAGRNAGRSFPEFARICQDEVYREQE